jgi:outer membrane protein TolC
VRWAELLGKAAETALGRRNEVAAMIKARSEAGITPRGDLNRAETAALRQRAAVIDLEGRVAQARADLAAALQLDEELVLTDEPLAEGTTLPPVGQALAEAERRRPELAQAQAQAAAQQQQVRVIKGALWPQLSLFARADAENHVFGVPQPRLIGNLSGGLLVTWLAFDSLATFQAARGAALEADKLAAERERTRQLLRAEVRTAHSRLATAVARRDPLTRALALAESTLGLIRRRHQAGAALFIEVLDAENELEELTTSVIGNSIEIAQARAGLTAAIGGP